MSNDATDQIAGQDAAAAPALIDQYDGFLSELGYEQIKDVTEYNNAFDFDSGDVEQHSGTTPVIASDYALKLDGWSRRQGEQMARACNLGSECSDEAAADFRAAMYEPDPQLSQKCNDVVRQEYISALLQTEQFQDLRRHTIFNEDLCEAAMRRIVQGYVTVTEKHPEPPKQEEQEQQDNSGCNAQGEGTKGASGLGDAVDTAMIESAIQEAISTAAQASSDVEQAAQENSAYADPLGLVGNAMMGNSGGKTGSVNELRIKQLQRKLKHAKENPAVRKIADACGRYRAVAQSIQKNKKTGRSINNGLELSGEISKVVSSELAMLVCDKTKMIALKRLCERTALSRKKEDDQNFGRGPIVVVVDESGSMNGPRIVNAKGFALAMAWIARIQKRYVCLVSFSSSDQGRYLAFKPGEWDSKKVFEWSAVSFGGGTDSNVPFNVLPNEWWDNIGAPKGKTDIVLITDGEIPIPGKARDSFLQWKEKEKVRLISIDIDGRRHGRDMTPDLYPDVYQEYVDENGDTQNFYTIKTVSDRLFLIPGLNEKSEAVREAFSI